jgi:hypothetical protein
MAGKLMYLLDANIFFKVITWPGGSDELSGLFERQSDRRGEAYVRK